MHWPPCCHDYIADRVTIDRPSQMSTPVNPAAQAQYPPPTVVAVQPQLVDPVTVTTWLTVELIFALLAAVTASVEPNHELGAADPEVSRANNPQHSRLVAISRAEVRRG